MTDYGTVWLENHSEAEVHFNLRTPAGYVAGCVTVTLEGSSEEAQAVARRITEWVQAWDEEGPPLLLLGEIGEDQPPRSILSLGDCTSCAAEFFPEASFSTPEISTGSAEDGGWFAKLRRKVEEWF